MWMLRRTVCLVVLLALRGGSASGEILDTLGGFDADAPGWSGALGATFSVNGGNTETVSISGSGQAQWQRGAERLRMIAGGTHETADGELTEEKLVLHLRHNHRLAPWVRSLLFAQLQQNPFQRLESRTLFGAGARFEPLSRPRGAVAIGAAYMLELERLDGVGGTTTEHRISTFVDLSAMPREGVTLAATSYVQPRIDDLEDVRISAAASIASRVVGPLSLVVSGSYVYDRYPPEDVERVDWGIESGLRVSL